MNRRTPPRRSSLRILAPAIAIAGVLAATLVACGQPPSQPVTGWISHNSTLLRTADPSAPLDDLAPVRRSIGNADVVGLGESVHGAAEVITLKHRALRLLVEQLGFRSIAWEEDWTTGLQINDYVRSGIGDPDALSCAG